MSEVLKKKAVQEAYKCGRDPIYFIENYCKVIHPKRGLVPLTLYDYQKEAITQYVAHSKVVVNKARQLGFSTITAAFIVWLIYFHKNKSVLIVATKADVAKNIIKKIKLILAQLPDWLYLADVTINQAHQVGLSNNSFVKAAARSDDVGRSEALSLLVIDEAAHIQKMDELWTGLYSTVSTGGKVIVLSTPKGIGNWFHKCFSEAETRENGFHPLVVNWWENPEYAIDLEEDRNVPGGYTSSWFRDFTRAFTRQEIAQELLTSFLESGDTFIDPAVIQKHDAIACEPIEERLIDKKLWIWKKPREGKKYLIAADTAGGGAGGTDNCSCVVMEVMDCEIVAEYKGKITPDVFADYLLEIAEYYNDAYIVPENNGVGLSTALILKRSGYRNLGYFDLETGNLVDRWAADINNLNPGYPMTPKSRPVILAKFQEFINNGYVKFYSKRIIKELQTFIVENGKPQAASGHNDDLIMALAIAIWVRDICPAFNVRTTAVDYMQMYGAAKRTANDFSQFQPSSGEEYKRRFKEAAEKQNSIVLPTGEKLNTGWIFKI